MAKRISSQNTEEQAFLAAYDASRFPHPSLSVDVALLTIDSLGLRAVMIKRSEHPDLGKWSLPGGFVKMDESLEAAAVRVMKTKAGVEGIFLEQLYTFGDPDRDPRTRIITVAYYALVDSVQLNFRESDHLQLGTIHVPWAGLKGGSVHVSDSKGSKWAVAFDHAEILGAAIQRLRGKLDYAPIGFELLPPKFTLRQLQSVHEVILGKRLNKDSFRRKLLASGMLVPTGQVEGTVGHRPAELYRFRKKEKRGQS